MRHLGSLLAGLVIAPFAWVVLALGQGSVYPYWQDSPFPWWQPVTYLFLHGDVFHLLFNMLALWMFGSALESDWGARRFLRYYFLTVEDSADSSLTRRFA